MPQFLKKFLILCFLLLCCNSNKTKICQSGECGSSAKPHNVHHDNLWIIGDVFSAICLSLALFSIVCRWWDELVDWFKRLKENKYKFWKVSFNKSGSSSGETGRNKDSHQSDYFAEYAFVKSKNSKVIIC